ncbi:PH domain-containing protein [Nonomuraea sp. SYSU D8015]|uniref:PH domain-containing protein n=1 Tax=Nonomuraea sp. SYSU D8015 TaxID=2593644 RepID=UPI0016607B55|nr:PH domain-containing protein [Nonomuraea sp. SYSU D8015]
MNGFSSHDPRGPFAPGVSGQQRGDASRMRGARAQDEGGPHEASGTHLAAEPRRTSGADVTWQRLSGRSLWASAVKSLAVVVPAVLGLTRFLTSRDWPVGGVVAACAGAALLIAAGVVAYDLLRLRATRWRLTADRLELRSGIAVRQSRSIPRDRVRSVDLRADPVRRVFGLTVVKVGTGERSAEGDELTLDPLTRHDAEALRRTLLLGDAPAAGPREEGDGPLVELRWSWIKYAPLSLWTFTGAAVVLGVAYKVLDGIGLKVITTEAAESVWAWVTARPLQAVPLLLAANAAVGALGAVLLFAESWGRYRLEREPGRLRLRRGLLTTRSLTLEERRLRGVEISEPLLLRLGGGARVKAIATGLGKAAENETEDVAALTPPLPRPLACRLAAQIAHPPTAPGPSFGAVPETGTPVSAALARIGDTASATERSGATAASSGTGRLKDVPGAGAAASTSSGGRPRPDQGSGEGWRGPGQMSDGGRPGQDQVASPGASLAGVLSAVRGNGLRRHPSAARRRRVVRALVTAVVLAGVAWAAYGMVPWAWARPWVWLVPGVALPMGLWLAVESARNLGHALGGRHLITRRGAAVRHTVALDRAGISGWTISESFFQRRNGLVTVSATTAAGEGSYDVVDVDRGDGLELAAHAVPGLLEPFLERPSRRR